MWNNINSGAPFLFGGILGIASAVIIGIVLGSKAEKQNQFDSGR
jgi:hypothetical protein